MTPVEFNDQIGKLKQVFGEKSYTPERTTVLFEYVKNCEARAFEYVVKEWIGDAKTAPLGDAFRDFARKHHSSSQNTRKSGEAFGKKPNCIDCHDKGWITLLMKPGLVSHADAYGYPVQCAVICTCSAGQSVKVKIESTKEISDVARRQFNSSHRQWYDVENRWEQPTFLGMTYEEFRKRREDEAHGGADVISLASRIGTSATSNQDDAG